MNLPAISLAVTHFNRFEMLRECIAIVLDDPRISEIVISDDASTDGSYEKLKIHYANWPKVKLFRNAANQDCYINKVLAVSRVKNDWVILFDSDNILPVAYLNTLFDMIEWDRDTVYCPDYAQPHFNYTEFAGAHITRADVAAYMRRPHFATALNTANYFFHKQTYLEVWDGTVIPHTADSIYHAFRLLQAGKRLVIVPGLRYFHRIHDGSHYKLNVHKTKDFATKVEDMLRKMK